MADNDADSNKESILINNNNNTTMNAPTPVLEPVSHTSYMIDNPCWGSSTNHSLSDLLSTINRSTTILYESDEYIAMNKPPDLRMDGNFSATVHKLLWYWYRPTSLMMMMMMQSSSYNNIQDKHTLLDEASFMAQLSNLPTFNSIPDNTLRPCHQLDYATSGVLLVARSKSAARRACDAFYTRSIKKVYIALVRAPTTTTSITDMVNQIPVLAMTNDQLEQKMKHMEQTNERTKSKRRKDTFNGYQPPHSLFMKWKGSLKQKNNTASTNHISKKRSFHQDEPMDLCDYIHQHVASKQDQEVMSNLGWSTLSPCQIQIFQELSHVYNDVLLKQQQQQQQQQEQQQQHEITKQKDEILLPTLFRLVDIDKDCFYIFASLATQPDTFAMKIKTFETESVNDGLEYRQCLTKCQILGPYDETTMKVLLTPYTGRRHQLRCHMVLCGMPIVGDATYGTRDDEADRMCLHSYSLELPGILPMIVAPDPWEGG